MRRGGAEAIGSHLVLENSNGSRLNSEALCWHITKQTKASVSQLFCANEQPKISHCALICSHVPEEVRADQKSAKRSRKAAFKNFCPGSSLTRRYWLSRRGL